VNGDCQALIVGGGIIGLATAMALARDHHARDVLVIEAEDSVATHQTGHNSGVIHTGVYYKPGSLKARLCVEGARAMYAFCREHNIPHECCGKLIVAGRVSQLPMLAMLMQRAIANGVDGVRMFNEHDIARCEPHARGLAALHVQGAGIVDFGEVAHRFAQVVREHHGQIQLHSRFLRADCAGENLVAETSAGKVHASILINCAGLQCDRVAVACGERPDVRVIPFRGEYFALSRRANSLVRNLIYPAPDPQLPFLGVHLTRTIHGGVEAGPNAVLSWSRHGYQRGGVNLRDARDTLTWPGFWKLAVQHAPTALSEVRRSLLRSQFLASARELVPGLESSDLQSRRCGVRAQAVDRTGRLLDDFHILSRPRMIHVLNAPSPAATSSIVIGRHIARLAIEALHAG
jgi:L-2-hydroxyglutarate oxidase